MNRGMRSQDKMQVNWHHINWRDFNETISMIERADAQVGVIYDAPKPRRPGKLVVSRKLRDGLTKRVHAHH